MTDQRPDIRIEKVDSDEGYNHVFDIRTQVFVEEEEVDQEDEYDGFDHLSAHFLGWYKGEPVAAARWRMLPTTGRYRLERLAVLRPYRGKGIGQALLETLLEDIPDADKKDIHVHVPVQSIGFFTKNGFEVHGETFEEAGMPHKLMIRPAQDDLSEPD